MNRAHLDTWEAENASLHAADNWLAWVGHVEELVALDVPNIDGDRSAGNPSPDPACIDELVDWYRDNWSTKRAADTILARIPAFLRRQAD